MNKILIEKPNSFSLKSQYIEIIAFAQCKFKAFVFSVKAVDRPDL